MRIRFQKGGQREFFNNVLEKTNCPSLKELSQRVVIKSNSLKNYYSERRTLPEDLFRDLCRLSGINENDLSFDKIGKNWGQVIGGKISRK